MSRKEFQVTLTDPKSPKGSEVTQVLANAGTEPLRLKAQPNGNYLLTDKSTGRAPQQIHARRKNKDLLIQLDDYRPEAAPDLIVENFYGVTPGHFAGIAEDAVTYPFVPNTAQDGDQFASLADGGQIAHVLGAMPAAATAGAAASPLVAAAGFAGLGGIAAAGAGALGLAALAGGGSGGGGGGGNPAPVYLTAALDPKDDTGVSDTDGITNKRQPTLSGKTTPGNKVFVKIDHDSEQEIPVNPDGSWTWKPDSPLTHGEHTITVKATESSGRTTSSSVKLEVDTQALAVTFTDNSSTLGNSSSAEQKLNIDQIKDGVTFKAILDSKPNRDLTEADLTTIGGTIKSGSLVRVSDTVYTFGVLPGAATDAGTLQVKLQPPDGSALTDAAGNPLTPATSAAVAYDNKAPDVSLFVEPAQTITFDQSFLITGNTLDTDLSSMRASILGQSKALTKADASTGRWQFSLAEEGLKPLENGYYTFKLTTTDKAGNTSVDYQVLTVNRGSLLPDAWTGEAPSGTGGDQLFINRAGNQTFTGSGGGDTFVWLARDRGTPGQPDTDIITDFSPGKNGQADTLNIRDFLEPVPDLSNLGAYVRISQVDTNGDDSLDSSQLSISSRGQFTPTGNASAVTDQIIILQNTLVEDLQSLLPNLEWQATGAVILA